MPPQTPTPQPPGQSPAFMPPGFPSQPPANPLPTPDATPPAPQPPKTNRGLIIVLCVGVGILFCAGSIVLVLLAVKKPSTPAASTTTNQATTTSPTTTPKTTATDTKDKALYIAGWGVSINYSGDVTLTYVAGTADNVKFLSSKELAAADPTCAADRGGVGTLLRAKLDEVAHFSVHTPSDMTLTGRQYAAKYPDETGTLGDYVYTYGFSSSNSCVNESAAKPTVDAIKSLIE